MSDDFRETLYTIDRKGHRKWVYPSEQDGFFRSKRKIVAFLLLALYCSLPWIEIGGVQAVFIDIAHRKFTFFGQTFWATDTKFLLMVLLCLAFSLFFFTAIFGRIWCGWACPETVFLEFVFRPIEAFFEGNAAARKRLDQSEWTYQKIRIKASKWLAFIVVAWFLASTVLAYFFGREKLLLMIADYPWNNLSTFILTLAFMLVLLFQFGWFREQFCTVLCPYARFQSVLLDDSSLLVGYDAKRGEPRGKAKEESNGDCIDCGLCVRVCPTGIDIRNGLQLECIQCAQCADACDTIMAKIGRPLGLVRYDTEKGLAGNKTRFIRPRVLLYAAILSTVLSILVYSVFSRELSYAQLLHADRHNLFHLRPDGRIENHLELRLENKDSTTALYSVVSKDSRVNLIVPVSPFPLAAESHGKLPLFANFDASILRDGKASIVFEISDKNGFKQDLKIELLGPG